MRNTLVKELLQLDNKNVYFLTADVGFGCLEPLQRKMGDRFINVGISEQLMISMASGLALSGKTVYVYTMCAFVLRAIEQIKLDLCYQDAKVTIIGVGTGYDYEYHGTTHFALEDDVIMGALRNIRVVTPYTKDGLKKELNRKVQRPTYIRLSRFDKQKGYAVDTEDKRKYPKHGGSLDYFLDKENEDSKR